MCCSFSSLSNSALLEEFAKRVVQDRAGTAELIACIAEIDSRKLYVPQGYPSMFTWCVGKWHMSEDMAFKRIQAARATRRHPAILGMLADGRLHLTAVVKLAPYLKKENAKDLLAMATHQTKRELERELAKRFPQPDLPTQVVTLRSTCTSPVVPVVPSECPNSGPTQLVPEPVVGKPPEPATARTEAPSTPARVAPLSPQRFGLQVTITESTHDKLMRVQALLAHQIPAGNLAQVLDRVLDLALHELEKRKFAATKWPREAKSGPNPSPRYVPNHVKRAVWARDGGQCTFVSDSGQRCLERGALLEFDHVEPVARGGGANIDQIRLLCHAHNQYAAECAFGSGFMARKREEERSPGNP